MQSGIRKTSQHSSGPRSVERSRSATYRRVSSRGVTISPTPKIYIEVEPIPTNNWDNESVATDQWSRESSEGFDATTTFQSATRRTYYVNDRQATSPLPNLTTDQWIDEQKRLKQETKLDNDLANQPGVWTHLHIPHLELVDRMDLALLKAQEIIYHSVVRYLPAKARQDLIKGPRSIVLGRGELSKIFGGSFGQENDVARDVTRYNKLGGAPPEEVNVAIASVIDIRNMQAHQLDLTSVKIDKSLKIVQELAILLRDRKRADELRTSRDELAVLVKSAFTNIKQRHLDSLTIISDKAPAHPEWEVHHQMTFIDVLQNAPRYEGWFESEMPAVVQAAAKRWSEDPATLFKEENPW